MEYDNTYYLGKRFIVNNQRNYLMAFPCFRVNYVLWTIMHYVFQLWSMEVTFFDSDR